MQLKFLHSELTSGRPKTFKQLDTMLRHWIRVSTDCWVMEATVSEDEAQAWHDAAVAADHRIDALEEIIDQRSRYDLDWSVALTTERIRQDRFTDYLQIAA